MNQYYWDDWAFSAQRGWTDQLKLWSGEAKHPLDPLRYFVFVGLGPWSFHLVMLTCCLVIARCLKDVLSSLGWFDEKSIVWSQALLLAMPVYHARLAVATSEYTIGLAALFLGWALLIPRRNVFREILASLLLIFAIGVPSLAILFPVIWLHVSWLSSRGTSQRGRTRTGLSLAYILAIPPVYAIVFANLINSRSKYRPSSGALLEFSRGLSVIIVIALVTMGLTTWKFPQHHSTLRRITAVSVLIYFSWFPYFAVGYNPLSDFLPWRMRAVVLDGLMARASRAFVVLLIVGGLAVALEKARGKHRSSTVVWASILPIVLYALAMVVLGPMDWESRHWLLTWPSLVFAILTIAVMVPQSERDSVVFTAVSVLLAASLVISSEYFVDALKQKALVQEASSELLAVLTEDMSSTSDLVVVVVETATISNLNARFRGYRRYEWAGLIGAGLNRDPRTIIVLSEADSLPAKSGECSHTFTGLEVSPSVATTRFEALRRLRVQASWHPRRILLCSDVGGMTRRSE
jgi:hypothetical protein